MYISFIHCCALVYIPSYYKQFKYYYCEVWMK